MNKTSDPAVWGAVLALLLLLSAIGAPWLAPHDPAALDLATRLEPPTLVRWMGSDELGRDILSRLLYGARVSLIVGTGVVALSLTVGLLVGAICGYYGG